MSTDNKLTWRVVSQDEYVNSVSDEEKLYHVHIEDGVPYLCADIEYGGDIALRVELFSRCYYPGFCMVPSDSDLCIGDRISDLIAECRGYYAGGICFIEYDTREEAEANVLNDFLNSYREYDTLGNDTSGITPIYIICSETSLPSLVHYYPNADLFVLVEEV